jgi:hypothetical protein
MNAFDVGWPGGIGWLKTPKNASHFDSNRDRMPLLRPERLGEPFAVRHSGRGFSFEHSLKNLALKKGRHFDSPFF